MVEIALDRFEELRRVKSENRDASGGFGGAPGGSRCLPPTRVYRTSFDKAGEGGRPRRTRGETARVMTNATRIKKLPGGGEPGGLSRFGRYTGCLQNPVGPWMP